MSHTLEQLRELPSDELRRLRDTADDEAADAERVSAEVTAAILQRDAREHAPEDEAHVAELEAATVESIRAKAEGLAALARQVLAERDEPADEDDLPLVV